MQQPTTKIGHNVCIPVNDFFGTSSKGGMLLLICKNLKNDT